MNLLDYEKLKVFSDKKDGRSVDIILYEKKKEEYILLNKDNKEDYISFLIKNKASNKANTIFIDIKDDINILAYVCMGDLTIDLLQTKENASTAGSLLLKNLSYLDEHLNFNINFNEYKREFISGLVLGFYKYNFLNKEKKNISTISILGSEEVNKYTLIYNGQNFVRFLGDTPANLMTPNLFVEYAKKYCANLKIEIFDKDFMKDKNMNLLLGVARGSNEDPKLLKISYKGKSSNEVDLSLVGKGITFDTGGISLKPSLNMSAMKGDMMGAATVLSTIKLASDFNLNLNIEAILPLTENMPGGKATKPGDVHIGMSGISVEIDNTDAEGRLILGDAITFAQESNPKYLLDIATLTGAISVALGENFIGYFSNDDKLSELIYESSINSNDPAWRMPLSSLFISSMKSNVADLKNAGGRKGGSCTAAIFLNEFIDKNIKWTHFDMAGVDWDHRNKTLYGSGMTGKGLPLLFEVVKNLSESE